VPFGCFAGINTWSDSCATGKISHTGKEWGDMVRAAFPGYTGPRPKVQLWHGANDVTLNYKNFDEDIKQWIDVLGLNATPVTSQLTLKIQGATYTYSRSCYTNSSNVLMLDAIKALNQDHNCKISEDSVISFFGLDKATPALGGALEGKGYSAEGASMAIGKSSARVFHFTISSKPGQITIDLFDLSGAKIRTIADWISPAGLMRFSWNATSGNDLPLPKGLYILSMKVDGKPVAAYRTLLFAGK